MTEPNTPPEPTTVAPESSQSGVSGSGGIRTFWRRRSRIGKALLILGAVFGLLLVIGLFAPAEVENDAETKTVAANTVGTATAAAEATGAPPETTVNPAPVKPKPKSKPKASPRPRPKPPTPQQRVREAVGAQVQAGGYAGELSIRQVSFEAAEVQVTVQTPAGGLEGASCADLDSGAEAVFKTIYGPGAWRGGAAIVYQGGLVDSATGEELPEANTGIFTMPASQAGRIDWSNEDSLLNINWALYRDFCHRALKQ